jgi:hypothetical protein
VPPASPDARAAIEAVLEPLVLETDRVDRAVADNRSFLDARRAPESVRRVAREVAAGRLTWDDVFAHRAGAAGQAFLRDAFATARAHVTDDPTPVDVPPEALEVGLDPADVATDIARTRAEAQAAHDAVFRP